MNLNQIKELAASIFGYNKKIEDYDLNEDNIVYASLSLRMLANLLDIIIFMIAFSPITLITNLFYGGDISQGGALTQGMAGNPQVNNLTKLIFFQFTQFSIYIVAIIYFTNKHGGTPGKIILRLRVINSKTFKAITFWQSIGRVFGYLISFLPITLGFVWIDFDKKKQGFHDKLANTLVIRLPKYTRAQLRLNSEEKN